MPPPFNTRDQAFLRGVSEHIRKAREDKAKGGAGNVIMRAAQWKRLYTMAGMPRHQIAEWDKVAQHMRNAYPGPLRPTVALIQRIKMIAEMRRGKPYNDAEKFAVDLDRKLKE